MNDIKRILVLATGGTIASAETENGYAPSKSIKNILSKITSDRYDITARDILFLDSTNIQPEEWCVIAKAVAKGLAEGFDGIVITHGTDTMAYTSSVLSFMLKGLSVPVVLTGSQLPLSHPLTDARDNLSLALAVAASAPAGVYLAFDRKVMLGCRAVKVRTQGFNAFESINYPYVATVSTSGLSYRSEYLPTTLPHLCGDFELMDSLDTNVFVVKLTPGIDPRIFDMLLGMHCNGIVIEAFGAGGVQFINRDLTGRLAMLNDRGVNVVVCSQCLYEISDLSIYEVGRRALDAGAIGALDMTTEAAYTKLMWAIGNAKAPEDVRRLFGTNLCGEIRIRS